MLNYSEVSFEEISIHKIGSKFTNEGISLSPLPNQISDDLVRDCLVQFFFDSFKEPEFYRFLNETEPIPPFYELVQNIFEEDIDVHETSRVIASLLYESSDHPSIKTGDLIVCKFNDLVVEGELVNALGIFKAENKSSLINLKQDAEGYYSINVRRGFALQKIDKACLIYETEKDTGYKMSVVDNTNKEKEASFWIHDFLNVVPKENDYILTKEIIRATNAFVSNELDTSVAEKADILQKTSSYLKLNDAFDYEEFGNEVFGDQGVQQQFKSFTEEVGEHKQMNLNNNFDISNDAYKSNTRFFRSVIKLDKNFHVYVHGNKNMIEKGMDDDGRKFYKLYYEDEA